MAGLYNTGAAGAAPAGFPQPSNVPGMAAGAPIAPTAVFFNDAVRKMKLSFFYVSNHSYKAFIS